MGCIIESIEEYFHLEKEYDVDVVIPLGKNISVEWYQYGNRFKLNEGGRIVGEGVISGEVCFD
ncbi:MAG TPA: hypothetical protein DCM07_04130 [Planctomycetaceae bacterium]|nr:hypothetical protein [Planctomycetaceae bacterium]